MPIIACVTAKDNKVYGSLSKEKSAVLFEAILQRSVFLYFDSINSPSVRKLFSSNNLTNF